MRLDSLVRKNLRTLPSLRRFAALTPPPTSNAVHMRINAGSLLTADRLRNNLLVFRYAITRSALRVFTSKKT